MILVVVHCDRKGCDRQQAIADVLLPGHSLDQAVDFLNGYHFARNLGWKVDQLDCLCPEHAAALARIRKHRREQRQQRSGKAATRTTKNRRPPPTGRPFRSSRF